MNTTKTAINIILNIVSAQCEVPIDSILSNIKSDRKPENKTTKYARWLAHWLIYEVTGLTQKEVSRNMDRPNPSLIHTSIKRVRTLRDVDEEYRAFSDNILQLCRDAVGPQPKQRQYHKKPTIDNPDDIKIRKCMTCQTGFPSTHKYNRICPSCGGSGIFSSGIAA